MSGQPPAEEEGPPLTELESLQLKCNQITDDSLDSTRRMKNLCEEAKDCGIKTLVMLDDQVSDLEHPGANVAHFGVRK